MVRNWLILAVLMLVVFLPGAAEAVEEFKVSAFAGSVQIWFEAEAFDERIPDSSQYFQVTGEPGAPDTPKDAFDEAITRRGGAGGAILWRFDIKYADGDEGIWYFWARVLNPNNMSDYMMVEGDPEDEIPEGPPFPGSDGTPPFDNVDDRVFEATTATWGWWGNSEGSSKELQDGENTMYMFHRQGDNTVFWDVFMWTDDATYRPSDDDYTNAEPMKAGEDIAVLPLEKLSATWGCIKNER
jgi:hypothetical protein